ncbi:MAG: helix-turn-helix transcriptional regulator [Myxococcota bacterium]|jgi:DNA-binding XRE family transcriptional regulator|nr:helix-turn-helix transcriptional regulator [Myxococcota bacterium]
MDYFDEAAGEDNFEGDEVVQNRVREIRKSRLMTQSQLANRAKLARRTVHSVEKGLSCRMDTKRKVLIGLGLTFEDRELVFPRRAKSDSEIPY